MQKAHQAFVCISWQNEHFMGVQGEEDPWKSEPGELGNGFSTNMHVGTFLHRIALKCRKWHSAQTRGRRVTWPVESPGKTKKMRPREIEREKENLLGTYRGHPQVRHENQETGYIKFEEWPNPGHTNTNTNSADCCCCCCRNNKTAAAATAKEEEQPLCKEQQQSRKTAPWPRPRLRHFLLPHIKQQQQLQRQHIAKVLPIALFSRQILAFCNMDLVEIYQ